MGSWNSSPHPISDLRDWRQANRLEIQPAYQRRSVWSEAAKIMLIDTILRDIPMPKILVSTLIKNSSTHRIVIDGQQRIRAIFEFLNDKIALKKPYNGIHFGKYFSDLSEDIQSEFLSYQIDFNEAKGFEDSELREVYSRVNKYTIALNKQELRRADFPGDFLQLSENLASLPILEEMKIFTVASRRRLGDVEFISELLAGLLSGPQDKKKTLDQFYMDYTQWNSDELKNTQDRFDEILNDIMQIFSEDIPFEKTRFRQRADFYSLFLAIAGLHQDGFFVKDKDLAPLQDDLELFDKSVAPISDIRDFEFYAKRCLSDANSQSSRKWRVLFIRNILEGTYVGKPTNHSAQSQFLRIRANMSLDSSGMCPDEPVNCQFCDDGEHFGQEQERLLLSWRVDETVFQLSNSFWTHEKCFIPDKEVKVLDVCLNDIELSPKEIVLDEPDY
jgi:hypothetical protein